MSAGSDLTKMKGYEEILEVLEPLLYAIPSVSETVKTKYSEFNSKKKGGAQFKREDLLQAGLKSLSGIVGYIVEDAERSGLLRRFIMKNASDYIMNAVTDMILGSGRN